VYGVCGAEDGGGGCEVRGELLVVGARGLTPGLGFRL
jgi:hypothetical protein